MQRFPRAPGRVRDFNTLLNVNVSVSLASWEVARLMKVWGGAHLAPFVHRGYATFEGGSGHPGCEPFWFSRTQGSPHRAQLLHNRDLQNSENKIRAGFADGFRHARLFG